MGKRTGCPNGWHQNIRAKEWEIAAERNERVRKKNDRIVGKGYAERQIADTLSRVEKIKTEL